MTTDARPRYPRSVLTGSASDAFMTVLYMHLSGQRRVLDLTYGEGISWPAETMFDDWTLVKSDLKPPYSQDLFSAPIDRADWHGQFDVVYYDPPWYVDVETDSDDAREQAYGGYGQQAWPLRRYQQAVSSFALFLRMGGKLIVKCGDQYHVPSRRLLLHHVDWCAAINEAYNIVDFYVYPYHRVSPTAYQVKDRPSAIVAHSYFIVGQRAL